MTIGRTFLFFAIIAFSVAGGFFLGRQSRVEVVAQKKTESPARILNLLKQFEKEKIRTFKVLTFEDEKFYAVVYQTDEPLEKDSIIKTSERLDIIDENGKIVYQHRDIAIGSLEIERFLKPDSRELVFSTNGGGTDNFINILTYRNGKFVEIMQSKDAQYRGGHFSLLQYRTGGKAPYFNPSQLILIKQQGGADDNPTASVFRTANDKFQKVGEIKMRELGDFIEGQLVKNKPAE